MWAYCPGRPAPAPGGSRSPLSLHTERRFTSWTKETLPDLSPAPPPPSCRIAPHRGSWRRQRAPPLPCPRPGGGCWPVTGIPPLCLAVGTWPWLLKRSSCCWLKTGSQGSCPPGARPRSPRTAFFPYENISSIFLRTHFLFINESIYHEKKTFPRTFLLLSFSSSNYSLSRLALSVS